MGGRGFDDQSTRTHLRRMGELGEEPRRHSLVVFMHDSVVTHDLPDSGVVTIGRSKSVEITIEDPSVSRRHAELYVGDPVRVRDLGSHNGTRVGDLTLDPDTWMDVSQGDLIIVGAATVLLQHGRPSEQIPSSTLQPKPADTATRKPPELTSAGNPFVFGPWLQRALPVLERVAAGHIPILLLGETGVGKEVLVELIHNQSSRTAGPFVRLNCAALPENLLESELFGYEKGAFTGAQKSKPGLLETADSGTVFLDEIGEVPLATQAKLLRVLEDGQFIRIGGLSPRSADVRIIAATNRDLEAEVEKGTFRRDLLYRLNAFTLMIPPLRERISEIEGLANAFIAKSAATTGEQPRVSRKALQALENYSWPGNIRELRNVIERAVLLCDGDEIEIEHLPPHILQVNPLSIPPNAPVDGTLPSVDLRKARQEAERQQIIDALGRAGGNQTQAAKLLGISRRTLVSRIKEFELPRPRKGGQ